MKVRNGFVSNSSSSSFVIAFKTNLICPHCGKKDPNILDAIKESDNYYNETRVVCKNYKEIVDHSKTEPSYYKETLASLKRNIHLLKSSYEFAMIDVSYHDENIREMIKNPKNCIMIHDFND